MVSKQSTSHWSSSLWRSKRRRIFSVIVALLLGLVVLGELSGWPFLRIQFAHQLSKLTASTVSLDGNFRAQLLIQPGIAVERVSVGSNPEVKVPHFLQAERLVVLWSWRDLWRSSQGEPLRLKHLEADQIDVYLVRLTNGNTSWAPARSESAGNDASRELSQVETLLLRAGTVVYRHEPLNVDIQVRIAQSTKLNSPLPWRATVNGSYRGVVVNLAAQAGSNLPLLLQTEGNAALTPLRLTGRVGSTQLDFDGATGALWAGQDMRGNLTLRGASLRANGAPLGITLPDTPPYGMRGRIALKGAIWSLVTDDTTVGSSALTAALQYDTATKPPHAGRSCGWTATSLRRFSAIDRCRPATARR